LNGTDRFTFDYFELLDGIHIVVLLVGLYFANTGFDTGRCHGHAAKIA